MNNVTLTGKDYTIDLDEVRPYSVCAIFDIDGDGVRRSASSIIFGKSVADVHQSMMSDISDLILPGKVTNFEVINCAAIHLETAIAIAKWARRQTTI